MTYSTFLKVFVLLLFPSAYSSFWKCSVVPKGWHYSVSMFDLDFLSAASTLTYWFKFKKYTPYNLDITCQSDWNKLWGKSRCGFFHHHHLDSDRFVWRAHPDINGTIQLAAYAYDNGRLPYQNDGTLLKIFQTTTDPGTSLGSRIQFYLDRSVYTLYHSNGTVLESLTIVHENQCQNFDRGYMLGLYFGGTCTAPAVVSVCYKKESIPMP